MGGGRKKGSRDRLSSAFLYELANDFEQNGAGVIKIARIEKPVEYLRIIASVLPKELVVEANALSDISDEELAAHITLLQKLKTKAVASTTEPDETRH
jgi:hypothetical protein